MDMFGVSAGTSVSIVFVVPPDDSMQTLRVEALSPSNSPTTSVSLASLNLTFARQSWHDEGRPVSFALVVEDRNASRRRQVERVHFRQDRPEALGLRLVRRCMGPRNCIPPGGLCRTHRTRVSRQRCQALLP